MQVIKYEFGQHVDGRGNLVALEERKDIPFTIKRVYFIYGIKPEKRRGFHAHRKIDEVMLCVSGSCKVKLDNGKETEIITLDAPHEGIYLSKSMWREMFDFSENAVLAVLASDCYKEEDYVRDYEEFKELAAQGYWESEG